MNSIVGLDIAKNVFHSYSQSTDGNVMKKKLKPECVNDIETANGQMVSANSYVFSNLFS